jgi:hypothetical protein
MTIFLILAPYGVFALLTLLISTAVSLFAGAAICLAVIAYDLAGGRSLKILGAGSVVVFSAVGGYVTLIDPHLSVSAVKFAVDTGIFLVTLISILIGRPFTLQYAIEVVDAETVKVPGFMKANYILGVDAVDAGDDGRQCRLDLCPGPAAVVRTSDRLRRPQQCDLLHQMVSSIPQGEVRHAAGQRPARIALSTSMQPRTQQRAAR